MEGYIAFDKHQYHVVEAEKRICANYFGVQYAPFADTVEGACQKAIASKQYPAHGQIDFMVLQIKFTSEQFVQEFKDKYVTKYDHPIPGWRYYGDVNLNNGNAFQWTPVVVSAYTQTVEYAWGSNGCGAF